MLVVGEHEFPEAFPDPEVVLQKGQAEIPEALLIVVMLFFGSWFGLLGVFVAPALVAVFICLYRNLYLQAIERNDEARSSPA
jgi:predicted PurR-regulated permease PerM